MGSFKHLLSVLMVALLASSTLSILRTCMGPLHGNLPEYHMAPEAQQFLAELQQQSNMANDPSGASLQQVQGVVGPEKIAPHGMLKLLYSTFMYIEY